MQPVFVILSPVPGLLYIGGKWAGELAANEPASLPVAPRGPIYIEHRPLSRGYLPMARRLVLSEGRIVKESIRDLSDVSAVQWPSGAIELELSPEPLNSAHPAESFASVQGVDFHFTAGDAGQIELATASNREVHSLPPLAEPPQISMVEEKIFLRGKCSAGEYLLALSLEGFAPLLSVTADEIQSFENGSIRTRHILNDVVGHLKSTYYPMGEEGYEEPEHEISWAEDAPRWPATPEETALAAAEAIQLGLLEEAQNYFRPEQSGAATELLGMLHGYSGVSAMKYGLKEGRNAVGLLRVETKNLLSVTPLYYSATAGSGPQGAFLLEMLSL